MAVTLGKINPLEVLGRRDAVHVQTILAKTLYSVAASTRVRFTDNTFKEVRPCNWDETPHGIVDPFLFSGVTSQNIVNILIIPGLTTDPVHHFDLLINDVKQVENTSSPDKDKIYELEEQISKLRQQVGYYEDYDYSDGCGPGCE